MSSSGHGMPHKCSKTAVGGAIFLLQHRFCKIVLQRVFHRHVELGAKVILTSLSLFAMVNLI